MSAEPAPTPQEHIIPQVEKQRTCRKVISIHQAHGLPFMALQRPTGSFYLLIKQCRNKTIIQKILSFYEVIKVNFQCLSPKSKIIT